MSQSHADLIAHPVRLRILMTIAGRQLSAQQIAELLPDIPTATLYLHIHKLAEAQILTLVEEIPRRGATEKVYALPEKAAELSRAELDSASPEDRWRYFAIFLSALSFSFRAYLEGYSTLSNPEAAFSRAFPLFLTHAERKQFRQELQALIERYRAHPATPERERHLLATILIPDKPESSP